MLEEPEGHACDQGGSQRSQEQAHRRDRIIEEAAEQCLPGGIRRIGDHRQAAAGDRALHDRGLELVARFGTSVAR